MFAFGAAGVEWQENPLGDLAKPIAPEKMAVIEKQLSPRQRQMVYYIEKKRLAGAYIEDEFVVDLSLG